MSLDFKTGTLKQCSPLTIKKNKSLFFKQADSDISLHEELQGIMLLVTGRWADKTITGILQTL